MKGCTCPPDKAEYTKRQIALFANVVPFAGQAVTYSLGLPSNCLEEYKKSAEQYADAQTRFVKLCEQAGKDFFEVVMILKEIYSPSGGADLPSGILPDTLALALQPGLSVTLYLSIIVVAIFVVVIGLVLAL